MKIMIVTDAWEPQVNGVVRTLKSTSRELTALGHRVELLTPLEFRTIACPTYPEIRLSLLPRRRVAQRIEEFAPDALHIATEGPLGMAARSFAIRNKLPFTTAYHTRFPEYVQARFHIPLAATYKFLHWFHKPSQAVMAPTPVVKNDLEKFGFTNVVLWTRGVDLDIFQPMDSKVLNTTRPIFLYVGRVAVEKNVEAFLKLDLPGSKWVAGEGPALAELKSRYPNANYLGVLIASGTGEGLRRRRCIRVPEPHRYLRPGAPRSHGMRHAGRGVPGDGSDRCARHRWPGRA
jgi:glycosyltransferase involved in cell wall biosynthesis